jgi:superfamily II DNA or RNA helicase
MNDNDLTKKLLPYQVPHLLQLYECLSIKNRVVDSSDTGTGKTYTAIGVSKMLKCKPFIICPKSVISNWINVCKFFEINILGIANYEMLKNGKYYTENYEIVNCPYMDKNKKKIEKKKQMDDKTIQMLNNLSDKDISKYLDIFKKLDEQETKEESKEEIEFEFYLPNDTIVIIDEAHRCKNYGSLTSKLLEGLHKNNVKIMLLSATLCDKLECFKPFGVILGLFKEVKNYSEWMKNKIKLEEIRNKEPMNYKDDNLKIKIIHNTIFPNFGSRMKIKELGDLFPKNNIIANCYFLQNHDEVDKEYKEINNALLELRNKQNMASTVLTRILRARQKIEMLKVGLILDLVQEGIDSNNSIAIFVNFKETLNHIKKHIEDNFDRKDISLIEGGQKLSERDEYIDKFQKNKNKIIICMIQAGNVGISLHDLEGNHPRISIISPSWSGQDMKQVFGRIHRAGSKSPAIQKLVYVSGTFEEKICDLLKIKLKNIDGINDGDFADTNITTEELEEINNFDNFNEDKLILRKKYKIKNKKYIL